MADSCLTRLIIAALNILLGLLFVAANTDFCGNVFETQYGSDTPVNLDATLSFGSVFSVRIQKISLFPFLS